MHGKILRNSMSKKSIFLKISVATNLILGGVLIMFYISNLSALKNETATQKEKKVGTICDVIVKDQQKDNIEPYTGKPAAVDFGTNPEAMLFKTRISEDVTAGANFAGHYTVSTWGCGTSCRGYAIVDVKTGKIIKYVPADEDQPVNDISFSINSNILVFNPRPKNTVAKTAQEILNEDGQAYYSRVYYELVESTDDTMPSLRKLCTENVYSGLVK